MECLPAVIQAVSNSLVLLPENCTGNSSAAVPLMLHNES